jgi:predicted  nucleic acid-binding Zn-ribbon protein
MKKVWTIIGGIGLIILFSGVSGTSVKESENPLPAETVTLMNEISGLEDKISALEYKLDKLESKMEALDYSIYKSGQEIIDKIEDVESAVKSLR